MYLFYPIFHCGLYLRAVCTAERLVFTWIFFSSKLATKNWIGISIPASWWTWHHAKFKGFVNKNSNLMLHRILTFMDHGIALPSDMMPCNALQCPCNALQCPCNAPAMPCNAPAMPWNVFGCCYYDGFSFFRKFCLNQLQNSLTIYFELIVRKWWR